MQQNNIEIREANLNDIDELKNLFFQLGYETPASHIQDYLNGIERCNSFVFVALSGENKVVGAIECQLMKKCYRRDPSLHVNALIVSENFRGKFIGQQLLCFVEKFALEKGCSFIDLCSNVKRFRAHHFYEALDYSTKTHLYFRKMLSR